MNRNCFATTGCGIVIRRLLRGGDSLKEPRNDGMRDSDTEIASGGGF
ncbi:MAG: hypothetical protein FWG98_10655 [Candidatus Cloacimonetes bacterium]|nr:hypothetical protein [Candidatus Cloacimonadota bacterium]